MNIHTNPNWISDDVQALIDPPNILLINAETKEEKESNIIKVKMRWKTASAASEMYEMKMAMFNNAQPE